MYDSITCVHYFECILSYYDGSRLSLYINMASSAMVCASVPGTHDIAIIDHSVESVAYTSSAEALEWLVMMMGRPLKQKNITCGSS